MTFEEYTQMMAQAQTHLDKQREALRGKRAERSRLDKSILDQTEAIYRQRTFMETLERKYKPVNSALHS